MAFTIPARPRAAALVTTAGVALAILSAGSPAAAQPAPQAPSEPLAILLTNDDGWNAPGITAVYDALVAEGHDVTLFAPATNQSGVGGRATFGGTLQVAHPAEGKYSVTGTPADSVEAAMSTVFAADAPDLVISGTNAGQNIAAATVHSGTVGAAVTALNEGLPAIAVSTELGSQGTGPYSATAAFVVDLVTQLEQQRRAGQPLLPVGLGLNVNYPLVDDGGAPEGVALTKTGTGFLDIIDTGTLPAVGATSTLTIGFDLSPSETVEGADSTALAEDKITITPITGNYDVDPKPGLLNRLIAALR